MKTLNNELSNDLENQLDNDLNQNEESFSSAQLSFATLDMPVYREMQDQPQSSMNVLELIASQFEQIHEANKRRSLLLKEVSQFILK